MYLLFLECLSKENLIDIKKRISSLKLKDRTEFGLLLEHLEYKTMIEIGVQNGIYANEILSKWSSFQKYYGIDPWSKQKNYQDWANVENDEQYKKYQNAKNILNKYGSKIELIRNYSKNAVSNFKNNSIDFIYLDGRHDYCGVYEDLEFYYPKLKCNGIMSGHDFDIIRKVGGQDYSLCENGKIVTIRGGAVQGISLIVIV
jgi:hypothetical protein